MYYITSDIDYMPKKAPNPTQYFAGFGKVNTLPQDEWVPTRSQAHRYPDYEQAERDRKLLVYLGHHPRYLHIGELP